jgi:hypothetical protein
MAWIYYRGLDLVVDQDSVEILKDGNQLYFKRFGGEDDPLPDPPREQWLLSRAMAAANEWLGPAPPGARKAGRR